jgi:large subunit ribosomal protein L4
MAKLSLIDLSGNDVGQVDVDDAVFGAEVKEHLLWEVVRAQRAKRRAGTANAQTRAEVSCTKAKIYKQKGTGNARHGSRRANVFRGGGVTHGPRPRSYAFDVNKKVVAGALRSALSLRAQAGDLVVVKAFEGPAGDGTPKTRALASVLGKISAPKALLVDQADNRWLQLSARNLSDAAYLADGGLNVYDILRYPKLLISEASLRRLEERLRPATRRVAEAGGAQ